MSGFTEGLLVACLSVAMLALVLACGCMTMHLIKELTK